MPERNQPTTVTDEPHGRSTVPAAGPSWTVADSEDLYRPGGWGDGYFAVSAEGTATVRLADATTGEMADIDLARLATELEVRGFKPPVLVRFPHILESRIARLHRAFGAAVKGRRYGGDYRAVFPIKVNQQKQVVEEVARFGQRFHHGFEVGSKPELLAALAYLEDREALLVCNGYKDRDFIDLALHATRIGFRVILVLEMPHELATLQDRADALGVEPTIGVRVKLAARSGGHWADSGGEESPFGLNLTQLVELIAHLQRAGHLGWMRMLHCHQGSQIPDLTITRDTTREATRIYAELVRLGAPMGYLNLGGGLAVDYEGGGNAHSCSATYTMEEYADTVVGTVADTLAGTLARSDISPPTLVTESGRALTAHYSMLITKVLDVDRFPAPQPPEDVLPCLPDDVHSLAAAAAGEPVPDAIQNAASGDDDDDAPTAEDGNTPLEIIREAFLEGKIGLKRRAAVETLVRDRCRIPEGEPGGADPSNPPIPDRYYVNFSVFQSLPDSWAIDQIFPVMPLHRLDEAPTHEGVLNDVTCDCDGRIKRYAVRGRAADSLPLHRLRPDEDYFLGIFLVGAYQETLSDLHNLFGDTHAVSIEASEDDILISNVVHGDSIARVLEYMNHRPAELIANFRRAAATAAHSGRITPAEQKEAVAAFQAHLAGYTYYEA